MKKENTVKSHRDFDRIIRTGQSFKSTHFAVYLLPTELGYARVGISVGKTNGIAVKRVLIKRQVRAMVAKAGLLPCSDDFILVIRPSYDPNCYGVLEEELLSLLEHAKEHIH